MARPAAARPPTNRSARAGRGAVAAGGALLVAGILAVAFNLRGSITGLPPVFPELTSATGLSTASEAVLAAIPVLGFGLFSGLAPAAARWLGEERVIGASMVLLAIGIGSRGLAPGVLLFPGTVLASCAIALMNVLLPSLVKRRRPDQVGLLIGLYLGSLTAGAVLGAAIAVPVFTALAGHPGAAVRITYGMWAVPAVLALLVWLPQLRFRTLPEPGGCGRPGGGRPGGGRPGGGHAGGGRPGGLRALSRQPLAWQVAAFMGLQSLSYYATLTWFPTLLRDHGASAAGAGGLIALMNVGNAITGLTVPVIAHRLRDQRALAAGAVLAILVGVAGTGFGPVGGAAAFILLLGLGQGAALGLGIFFFTARAVDGPSAAALSGFGQGVGYLIASAGPLLIGLLHSATGGWAAPVGVLLIVGCGQLAAGLLAGRAVQLRA